ncbi:diguanylate cyclase domain-containing protein [Pseudogulbenkiania sp. MAI-1]|uniref:sensor domain-containing diguanylate cyclase n=1 Tax=Pseudogulbenkiania sp. MAI-1 TaxID=990370 RepID=UPI00045EA59A|nr:diguanylate cyclase [Pseudogulbenkiania sp. MAI-1]
MKLSEEVLQPLIDTLPGGVLLIDADTNRIVHANQLSSILLGVPYNELAGQPFFPFLADDPDGRTLMQALEQRGMLYNYPCVLRSSSGRPFQVSLLMRRLPQTDRPVLVVSFSDQSENKILGQLLDYERQLLNRTLKLVKTLREEIQQHELEDSVSGVMGIRSLMSNTQTEVGRAHRYGSPLAGLLLRLDEPPQTAGQDTSKDSNLTHLHQLTSSLCIQASRESDLIAKREDGALVMILPNTTLDGSKLLALRLLRSLSQLTLVRNGKEEHHTASIGGSSLRQEERSPKAMLERMDLALQVAQARGGNQLIMQS